MVLLAACGDSSESSENNTTNDHNNNDDASGELVIYTARDQEVVDKMTEMFNEKYPDIDLEVLMMVAQEIMERVRGEKEIPGNIFWWGGTQSALMQAT